MKDINKDVDARVGKSSKSDKVALGTKAVGATKSTKTKVSSVDKATDAKASKSDKVALGTKAVDKKKSTKVSVASVDKTKDTEAIKANTSSVVDNVAIDSHKVDDVVSTMQIVPIDLVQEKQLADNIARFLISKKAHSVIALALGGKTTIADYFVIASSINNTHTRALAEQLDEYLSKDLGIEPLRREGLSEGKWVALDYSSVIVHIFNQDTRDMYQLEKLWRGDNNIIEY